MKFLPTTLSLCLAALVLLTLPATADAQAAPAVAGAGLYIGTGFGAAFGNREIDDSNSRNDETLGHAAKLYVGYQLTDHFGVQAGYVRLRGLNQNTGSGSTLVQQTVSAHSVYMAGTGRLALGASFALTGKVGVSAGKVTDASPANTTTDALRGSQTSLLVGSGVEYRLNDKLTLSIELESYGQLSRQVKGSTLTFGSRIDF